MRLRKLTMTKTLKMTQVTKTLKMTQVTKTLKMTQVTKTLKSKMKVCKRPSKEAYKNLNLLLVSKN